MGYPELLHVLEEEAGREARELLATADAEAVRVRAEARAAADAARGALAARERGAAEARARSTRESLGLDRERALLVQRRTLLAALEAEVRRRLVDAAPPGLEERLLAELLAEAPPGPLELIVDPGREEEVRGALSRLAPEAAARTRVVPAPERRGGLSLVAGRLVLDDTLPARLERAWPSLEAELAALLFAEG